MIVYAKLKPPLKYDVSKYINLEQHTRFILCGK